MPSLKDPTATVHPGPGLLPAGTVPASALLFVPGGAATTRASEVSYSGDGAWADGTTNPPTSVDAQLTKIITDLVATTPAHAGSDKLGARATTATWADGTTSTGATIQLLIEALITALISTTATHSGADRVGAHATTQTFVDTVGLTGATVEALFNNIVQQLATSSGASGAPNQGFSKIGATTTAAAFADGFHPGQALVAPFSIQALDENVIGHLGGTTGSAAVGSTGTAAEFQTGENLPGTAVLNQFENLVTTLANNTGGVTSIVNVTNNAGAIEIQTSDPTPIIGGQQITIWYLAGSNNAIGVWTVGTVIDSTHFTLSSSTFVGPYNGPGYVVYGTGNIINVTNATNNGGSVELTLASPIPFDQLVNNNPATGFLGVFGVFGTTEANGGWIIEYLDHTHVLLIGSTFVHAYTGGGQIVFFTPQGSTRIGSGAMPQFYQGSPYSLQQGTIRTQLFSLLDFVSRPFRQRTVSNAVTIDANGFPDITIFCDTTGIAFNLNLPTPTTSVGRRIYIIDSKQNFGTNAVTLHRFGAEKINGVAADYALNSSGSFNILTCDGTSWFVGTM